MISPQLATEVLASNIHFQRAYNDYINARKMVQNGLIGNCQMQRARLLTVYYIIVGK